MPAATDELLFLEQIVLVRLRLTRARTTSNREPPTLAFAEPMRGLGTRTRMMTGQGKKDEEGRERKMGRGMISAESERNSV